MEHEQEAAPAQEWQEQPTVKVDLETEPGKVSLERLVAIMTGKGTWRTK